MAVKIIADEFDRRQVGVATYGVETHKAAQHLAAMHTRHHLYLPNPLYC
jgi:hypothetical protein